MTVNGRRPCSVTGLTPQSTASPSTASLSPIPPGLVYYLLNKPAGVVCTADDPQGSPTVLDLVPDRPRVFPVRRLDPASEGLLILTNDGELTHRLTHPSFGVPKEYLVEVVGEPSPGAVRRLREGVELDDGPTAPARVSVVAPTLLRIVIHEGRNRQVRRMCDTVGHPVVRLVRTGSARWPTRRWPRAPGGRSPRPRCGPWPPPRALGAGIHPPTE